MVNDWLKYNNPLILATCVPNNSIITWTVDDTKTGPCLYNLTLSVTEILTGTYRCEVTSVRPEGIDHSPGMHVSSANMEIAGEPGSNQHLPFFQTKLELDVFLASIVAGFEYLGCLA